jgi:hypothetical protein
MDALPAGPPLPSFILLSLVALTGLCQQLLGLEFVFSAMMPGFQRSHFPLLTLNTDAFSFLLANITHHVTAQPRFQGPLSLYRGPRSVQHRPYAHRLSRTCRTH